MSWWSKFDLAEVEADFRRIAACGLDSVRMFLTWEDFQPAPDRVDPTWALGGSSRDLRFRVVSGGRVVDTGLRNWYTDSAVGDAQVLFAAEAAAALAGHEAVWAWDLGNENSNCVIPPTRSAARAWLARLSSAIRSGDATALVTVGLHMEDLEEDRRLGPPEASEACDLLSMHGYPIYARWADGPTDHQVLPFLARVTHWLGEGDDVVFSEFGLPSLVVEDNAGAAYTARALEGLRRAGCLGALLWCYSDYDPALWESPPFDLAPHERSFGLWRADGSPKPAVAAIAAFVGAARCTAAHADAWIDIDRDEFRLDPRAHLPRLYRRYREQSRGEAPTSGMTD